ncbi:unnamed protein product [Rhizoctonia solani]|uniref:BTB domain-containing protein n=1 Tax=Rhizoctonia solani TaxID=456999 RepID=A0A8H2WM91_9AGAM|nr:unnamed protein product [Rhizoctonia solani]
MLNRDSSIDPPINTEISWDIPPKGIPGRAIKALSHQNIAKLGRAPEIDIRKGDRSESDHSSDEESDQLKTQTTTTADSGPTCDPAFNFGDTNIQIRTGNRLFRIHQFKLNEFDGLRPKLEQATKDEKEQKTIKLQDDPDDFHNLLIVLYSSAYDFHLFSSATLQSTLKLATKYAHPTLRAFAIKELEKHTLDPIEQFALSRDCGVTEWMSKAIDDLCWRDLPITVAEARILGPEKFVEVAARREDIRFERGARVRLGNGQSSSITEADTKLAASCQSVSQDLRCILAASNKLLATNSKNIESTSKEGLDLAIPARDHSSNQFSFGQPSLINAQFFAPVIGFTRYGEKLPASGLDSSQPNGTDNGSFQLAKARRRRPNRGAFIHGRISGL